MKFESLNFFLPEPSLLLHDSQHSDTQYNGTQHNISKVGSILCNENDIQCVAIQRSFCRVQMLSIVILIDIVHVTVLSVILPRTNAEHCCDDKHYANCHHSYAA